MLFKSITVKSIIFFLVCCQVILGETIGFSQDHVLKPVDTSSPQATYQSFIESMESYRQSVETKDGDEDKAIEDAMRTLDMEKFTPLLKKERGPRLVIYLKEILDRIPTPDFEQINNEKSEGLYRFPNTEIYVSKVKEGVKKGEFLFSPETVERLKEFYDKVKHLPLIEGKKGALYHESILEKYIPKWSKDEVLGLLAWQWIGNFSINIG